LTVCKFNQFGPGSVYLIVMGKQQSKFIDTYGLPVKEGSKSRASTYEKKKLTDVNPLNDLSYLE
jgi:hypothetical protein